MIAYYITSDTNKRKLRLIAVVNAEIFKFKNRSVGNFVKYIYVNLLQEPCVEPIYVFSNNYDKFAQRKLLLSSDV